MKKELAEAAEAAELSWRQMREGVGSVTISQDIANRLSIIPGNPEVVQMTLEPKDEVSVEPGAMCYMSPGVMMETSLGDDGLFGAVQRVLSGEPFFINTFVNQARGVGILGLAAPNAYDKIVPINLMKTGSMLCARDAYLCSL
eukprot:gene5295-6437_t